MSRAYLVYILMFALFAAGMWIVLTLGRASRAPDDLSGEWQVTWNGALPPGSEEPTLRIEQSGRFFVVQVGRKPPMSLKLLPGWKGQSDGPTLAMGLDGTPWKMNVSGKYRPTNGTATTRIGEIELELIGPTNHSGIARRVGIEAPTTRATGAGVAHGR